MIEVSSGSRLVFRTLDSKRQTVARKRGELRYETCLRDTVKLERAHGECLGVERRRRTWIAAKSFGELRTSVDPKISESGNRLWSYTVGSS